MTTVTLITLAVYLQNTVYDSLEYDNILKNFECSIYLCVIARFSLAMLCFHVCIFVIYNNNMETLNKTDR